MARNKSPLLPEHKAMLDNAGELLSQARDLATRCKNCGFDMTDTVKLLDELDAKHAAVTQEFFPPLVDNATNY